MANNVGKMFKLRSSDGEEFVVPEAVAMQFEKIYNLFVDDCTQNAVPLSTINSTTLATVIQYCSMLARVIEKATEEGSSSDETAIVMLLAEEFKDWDAEIVKTDTSAFIPLMNAAHSLGIETLKVNLMSRKMAEMIMEKRNPAAVCRMLSKPLVYSLYR